MPNKPGYFKGYYEENKEEILQGRKKRYAEDPAYREKVLKSSQEYRDAQRQEPRVKMPRYQKPLTGSATDGTEVQLFSVGALAVFLGRSVQAINHWEKHALIPRTPYRDDRGFRYFTPAMMEAIKEEVGTKKRLFPIDPEMQAKIKAKWESLGVPLGYKGHDPMEAIALTRAPDSET